MIEALGRGFHGSDLQAEEKLLQEGMRTGMPRSPYGWGTNDSSQGVQTALSTLVSLTWKSSSDDLAPPPGLIGCKQVLVLFIHMISDWDFSQAPPRHRQQSVPGIIGLFPTSLLQVSPGAASAPPAVCCPYPLIFPFRISRWAPSRPAGEHAPFRRGLVPQLVLTSSLSQTQPR